jgi:hypothetical protein
MLTNSHNSTLHPTNIDSGITNSGLLGFYCAPHASVSNYDDTAPTTKVHIANGPPVQSIASGKLALVTTLPATSRKGHIMAGFPHSLIGLSPFVDAGY